MPLSTRSEGRQQLASTSSSSSSSTFAGGHCSCCHNYIQPARNEYDGTDNDTSSMLSPRHQQLLSSNSSSSSSDPNPTTQPQRPMFTQVPRHKQRPSGLSSSTAVAAAADAATFSTSQQLDGIVPYISSRAPQLKGRGLAANPLQDLWQAAAKSALRAELLLAAVVDKHKIAPYIMSALAGVLLGTVSTCLDMKQLQQQQLEAAALGRSCGLCCWSSCRCALV